jgi:hypothetical protein
LQEWITNPTITKTTTMIEDAEYEENEAQDDADDDLDDEEQ